MNTRTSPFKRALQLLPALALSLPVFTGCQLAQWESDAILDCAPGRPDPRAALRSAMTLHASFDHDARADFALGDRQLYHAPAGNQRTNASVGLPDGGLVQLAEGQGVSGGALRFTKKMSPVLFFRGETNLAYRATNWSGSVSFWLKLDPDQDLAPGYCDVLQLVGQAWDQGNLFVEFSKDEKPRHLRYAIQPLTKLWNPEGRKWEEIPEGQRPMVAVHQPPFSREKWTHVVFTFANLNTGTKDGIGRLYLNGELQGAVAGFEDTFNWDPARSAVTLGVNYVGLFDDLTLFNRALTPDEVKTVYQLNGATGDLLVRKRECVFRCLAQKLWPGRACSCGASHTAMK